MDNKESEFLTTKQACDFLGIRPPTLYKLTRNREISFYKPNGKLMYFDRNELCQFVTRHRYPAITLSD